MPAPAPAPTAADASAGPCLLLTSIVDGGLSGGLPKALELYATCDVPSTAAYGLGKAANGNPSGGQDFSFSENGPTSLKSGQFVYVKYEPSSKEGTFKAFFGFEANYSDSVINVNGNDAIELYWQGSVVDVYGNNSGVDGSGEAWEYTDGWAYRVDGTAVSSSWSRFDWTVNKGALDGYDTNVCPLV